MASIPESNFDKRTVTRNIKRAKLTQKDYDQYINGLEDVSDKSTPLFVHDKQEQEDGQDLEE